MANVERNGTLKTKSGNDMISLFPATKIANVDGLQTALNNCQGKLKVIRKYFNLNSSTWTASSAGLFYTPDITISELTDIYSITPSDYGALRATDVIVPFIKGSGNKIYLTSNVSSFYSNNSSITLTIIGV